MIRRPPSSPLFPSTTLSRSLAGLRLADRDPRRLAEGAHRVRRLRIQHAPATHEERPPAGRQGVIGCPQDRKSTRLNSSHANISYAVFCLKKKKTIAFRYTSA